MYLICDIDGVLTRYSNSDYEHYHNKNYSRFSNITLNKKCDASSVNLVRILAVHCDQVIFLTGRHSMDREATMRFLKIAFGSTFIEPDNMRLVMKPIKEMTSLEFKQNFIKSEGLNGDNVKIALDDREDIVSMYRKNDINAVLIGKNFPMNKGE